MTDDLTPEERKAQGLYLRPMNPDPVSALAKYPNVEIVEVVVPPAPCGIRWAPDQEAHMRACTLDKGHQGPHETHTRSEP